jgi:hypothetical protein
MKKIIIKGYSQAGDDFLALKLKKVFAVLTTPEEVALHNDMVRDIQAMVVDYDDFGKSVARIILSIPKNFLLRVANLIRTSSVRNIENGT